MRPVSQRFLDALTGDHKARFEARVVTGHPTGVDPAGVTIPIVSGDVTSDGSASIRSTLDMTTQTDIAQADPVRFPTRPDDLLAPYGNEVFCRRGIEYGDRTVEWVSLGYYRIDSASQDQTPLGEIALTGSDRMAGIVDGRLVAPVQFPAGTTFEAVFETLILDVYPTAVVSFDFDATAVVLNRSTVVEEDRYAFLRDLADAYAKDFFVRYDGVFRVQSRPDPASPVWTVAGGAYGVLVEAAREINREGFFNAVVATGEGADTVEPVRGVAYDTGPTSPTRWGGPFGKVPRFYSSPFVTTAAQARSAARKLLLGNIGLPSSLDLATVPNPALEPWDPIAVRVGRDSYTHLAAQVKIGLTVNDPVQVTTQDQTAAQIGTE